MYKTSGGVLKEWLSGIKQNPFASAPVEESATAKLRQKQKETKQKA